MSCINRIWSGIACVGLIMTASAHADLGDQLFKLLADDGAPLDVFGYSVGISGDIAIAGARGDGDNGPDSGSAYLFDVTSGEQLAKFLANDGAVDDLFGYSVAISGVTAVVGAIGDDENAEDSGAAYLFDVTDPSNPVQIAKLLPDDGVEGDRFGVSVAISGATAIVGTARDGADGDLGVAYLFDTATGRQIATLVPDDLEADDRFGLRVAISGATAIVGAWGEDADTGAAYLFDATSGRQIARLVADDGVSEDGFGDAVAISEDAAIVGALLDDDNGRDSGSAYVFDISDPGNPVQVAKLLADDGGHKDWFGASVALSGTTAIVGAYRESDNGSWAGAAYLFDITTGRQLAKLLADDEPPQSAEFGTSVGISGAPGNEIAIVGVGRDDDNGDGAGAAYLFDAGTPGECPWDLDDSGEVETGDLILLLGSWGDPYGTADLIELLGNWGPCPK